MAAKPHVDTAKPVSSSNMVPGARQSPRQYLNLIESTLLSVLRVFIQPRIVQVLSIRYEIGIIPVTRVNNGNRTSDRSDTPPNPPSSLFPPRYKLYAAIGGIMWSLGTYLIRMELYSNITKPWLFLPSDHFQHSINLLQSHAKYQMRVLSKDTDIISHSSSL